MAYINIFGKNIFYEIYGENHKETLVYFHGGPGASCLDFEEQAKRLAKERKVILFDQYGVLRSEAIGIDENYSMKIQIEMIEEMRKKLFIADWDILGHSYGGMLAVLYAKSFSKPVNKLILDCPSLYFADSAVSTAKYMSEYFKSIKKENAFVLCEDILRSKETGKTIAIKLLEMLDEVEDMKVRNYLHNISYEEYCERIGMNDFTGTDWNKCERHLMKLFDAGDMFENFLPVLISLKKAVLLLNGKYDPACSENQKEYILSNCSNIKQILFEKSGHFPRMEEPEKYTESILRFLDAE